MATMAIREDGEAHSWLRRLLSFIAHAFGNSQSIKFLEISSGIMLVVVAIITALILTDQGPQSEPLSPAAAATMLVANLLPATFLLVLFGRRVALKRAEQGNIGSKQLLHVRLVAIFSAITAVPTLLLVIFASLLFQSGVQFWFSNSARDMLENAGALAKGYYEEKLRDVGDETVTMASDFRYILNQTKPDDPAFLDAYFEQVLRRKLSESAIVSVGDDGVQRTVAVVSPDDNRKEQWIKPADLARLKKGEDMIVSIRPDRIEAVAVLFNKPDSYLYTNRTVTVPSFMLGAKAQSVLKDYEAMVARSRNLQLQFNAALYGVSLFVIGITLWIALLVADRLVRPVNNLVQAAQRIADGDLSARVAEDDGRADEVGFLSQSFNRMTERLQTQTSTLLTANRQLDDRRAFIEAVLESVSAGVISVDDDGAIQLANSTAEKLLSADGQSIVGQAFRKVAPTLAELADEQARGVLQLGDGPEPLTVAVKVSVREGGKVVTFEDISQQLADQRRAAWSDVARRIAHEIKNPLTPIQLAAERLQRRFGKQIQEGAPIFEQLTSTIVRQVGDLRNIVDEFSSFARMPKPVFRNESLTDIVGHAVFLFEVAHTDIQFEFVHDNINPNLICDRRQLGQAITNILKNAVESIEERKKSSGDKGRIEAKITVDGQAIKVRFTDNGTGLPQDRDRIVEPYITTRSSGSGLGLAIVKKIVEEHFAEIGFDDADGGGAVVTLTFSPDIVAEKVGTLVAHVHTPPENKDQN
jgi:two-component system, NtrC family, nitrogen regulation sensor histidine kinase NtrY